MFGYPSIKAQKGEGWRGSRAQPGSWDPSTSAILLHSLKLQGPGDRKASDGRFSCIPLPHSIHVLLLTNSPGSPHISSAPSLPVGAQAIHPFPHRCSGAQQRLGQAVANPAALPDWPVQLWPGDCRAGLGKGCRVNPDTAPGWCGQSLPGHILTPAGFALGWGHPQA